MGKKGKGKQIGPKKPYIGRWRAKRIRKGGRGSHVQRVSFERLASKGGRPVNVVVKQVRRSQELIWKQGKHVKNDLPLRSRKWAISPTKAAEMLERLDKFGIPVEEVIEVNEEEGWIKSKDYTKGDTHRAASPVIGVTPGSDSFKACPNKEEILKGIFRDTAILHSHGFSVSGGNLSFEPWMAYEKKKDGKWARRVIDVGALKPEVSLDERYNHIRRLIHLVMHRFGEKKGTEFVRKGLEVYMRHLKGKDKKALQQRLMALQESQEKEA